MALQKQISEISEAATKLARQTKYVTCVKWFCAYICFVILHLSYIALGFVIFLYIEEGLSFHECMDISEASKSPQRIVKNEKDVHTSWKYEIQEQIEQAINKSVNFTLPKEKYGRIAKSVIAVFEKSKKLNGSGYLDVNKNVQTVSSRCWNWFTFPLITISTIGKLEDEKLYQLIVVSRLNDHQIQQFH